MTAKAFIIYRVRGNYYVTASDDKQTNPSTIGRSLVSEIPEDPAALETWKHTTIAIYKAKEDESKRAARQHARSTFQHSGFSPEPTRVYPARDPLILWIYVLDLDQNVFRVSDTRNHDPLAHQTQFFRLDNIPRNLFTEGVEDTPDMVHSVMSRAIPAEHFATHLDGVPDPDPVLLRLYESLAPAPQATFSLPTGDRRSPWHRLQLDLIRQFVQYFVYSFHDSSPSRDSSPFVFRQMAYAILCLTSREGMRFHRTTAEQFLYAEEPPAELRSPWWEPPDSDTYWLGDILIALDQHLSVDAPSGNIKASIARTIQLPCATTPTTAIILSVHALIIVHIVPGEPITHTIPLPLLTLDPTAAPFTPEALACLDSIAYATPGVLALLDLFSTHMRIPHFAAVSSAQLPVELCRMVFRAADEDTQVALEASCRLFRALAAEYPRIGGRTVVKWEEDDSLVVGTLEGCGWQVAVWGAERVELNMPLLRMKGEREWCIDVFCEDLGIYLVRR